MTTPDATTELSLANENLDRAERRVAQYLTAFPDIDREAIEAGFRLTSVHASQSAALMRLFTQLQVDVTLPRHSVLRFLFLAEPKQCAQNEIKSDLGVSSPTVTFLIDGLEASELVVRSRNPADRREIFVALTERGREMASKFVMEMPEYFGKMFTGLSASERRTLNRLLKKLEHNADGAYPG